MHGWLMHAGTGQRQGVHLDDLLSLQLGPAIGVHRVARLLLPPI